MVILYINVIIYKSQIMKKIIILFAIIIIIASCTHKEEPVFKAFVDDNNCAHLPLSNLGEESLNMDSLYEDFFYIQPELTDNSIIADYSKVIIKDNKLFIMDNSKAVQGIFVFDMDGKFLFNINKRGNGPGEYTSVDDFYVNEKNKTIGILNRFQILIYDYNGSFLSKSLHLAVSPIFHSLRHINIR